VIGFSRSHRQYRFIFVDDGSSDATAEMLAARLTPVGGTPVEAGPVVGPADGVDHAGPNGVARGAAHTSPRYAHHGQQAGDGRQQAGRSPHFVEFISYPVNRGKGHAIRTAIAALGAGDDACVCFMDGDMAYSLDHLKAMLESLKRCDVVIGSRKESPEERRNTRKFRRLMGWVFNRMVRVGMDLPYADTQAGLKGFRGAAARRIFPQVTLRGFAFDVEALFIARRLGMSIGEIPARVSRSHRKKPSNVNLATEPLRMLGDLMRIRWNSLLGRYR
jgi:glycosyltransferase involved in cell wall biosynthesis